MHCLLFIFYLEHLAGPAGFVSLRQALQASAFSKDTGNQRNRPRALVVCLSDLPSCLPTCLELRQALFTIASRKLSSRVIREASNQVGDLIQCSTFSQKIEKIKIGFWNSAAIQPDCEDARKASAGICHSHPAAA